MALQAISKLISLKPEPQTTPSLSPYIQQDKAKECVSEYYLDAIVADAFQEGI